MTPMKSFSPAFLSFFFFLLFAFCSLGRVTAQVCGSIAPPEPPNLKEMLERQKQNYVGNYPESLCWD